ncbi:chemotaxis response regulator protein-glutamate methylesterase [soil metagenome]|uniref:chemotaxis protein CheB n=1 Tax=Sphingobium sp. CECT 9361 TaxID=2845384 RepID=UPI001E378FBD|nr:chemotaxis protein CheB [Sphingobium sp. CECT 9361]CAH0351013.1 Protein-glutamate methylesterase/protein-glutamine glutaminase [Sphingobium sp. CECT 9361]|tara:strand:+ start:3837 stop:4910 length:1074 start_codon:yes stop_codon:yes gene_type:complete
MSSDITAIARTSKEGSPYRVLIVDDSVVARTVLERILAAHGGFVVTQKTSNAQQALDALSREPVDLVLLDVEMPGQSGIVALPAILKAGRGAKVIILSAICEEGSAKAVEALALGASDILSKPDHGSFGDQFARALLGRIVRIVGSEHEDTPASIRLRADNGHSNISCLGVGASTGGIHALGQLFAGMTAPLGVPILITQHLPPTFIPYFAKQLARMTNLPVKVAEDGEVLTPDKVYIAPGEANLGCRRSWNGQIIVALSADRTPLSALPAVDPMFMAMARCYGSTATGVVLTGMGRDGTVGAGHIVDAGGMIIAQDEPTSVVWGMPGSVARAGLATALLPPEKIMAFVAQHSMVMA